MIALVLFQSFSPLYAQSSLSGAVKDQQGQPVPFANVLLLHSEDSTLAKGAVSDEAGIYEFNNVKVGNYRIATSIVGYVTSKTEPFIVGGNSSPQVPLIVLKEGKALDEVTVTSTKLLYELEQDRMVMNVEALPSMSGNTGLELLQKVPGVIVDRQNGSISIIAKGEILVMINDKIQRMPTEVIMAQLQGMRAENIERIELIQQPPAKYDASGAAGMINIVLKENNQQGTNGSISLNGGYGQREKAGLSLNLNSRRGIMNWYGSYNYTRSRANEYTIHHFREYDFEGDQYYFENLATLHNYHEGLHGANLGLDLNFGDNTVAGLLVGSTLSNQVWGSDADSRSVGYVNDVLTTQEQYLFETKTNMSSLTANAYLIQQTGANSHLNFNLDYASIHYENSGYLKDEDGPESSLGYLRETPMEFWILGLDHVNTLGEAWKMEVGLKGTFNNTLSGTSFQSTDDDVSPETQLFSEQDIIQEQILAAFISFNGKLSEKLDTELGVRYEHYNYKLDREEQENLNNTFKRPFPVFRLNYKVDSVNTIQLAYNRSITRPAFFFLTSFLVFFDPSLVVYANPQLQPTFTNNVKVSWQRNATIFSLAYLDRSNQIYFYNTVDKENHLQTSVPNNLDQETIIEANLGFPLSPAPWWEISCNLTAFYHKVIDQSGRPSLFERDIFTYAAQLNSTISLGKTWSFGIDGRYMSQYLDGDQVKFDFPYINLGFNKEFVEGSSLSLTLQDIGNSAGKRNWEYHQPEIGIRTFGENNFSERQLRITFTTTFGNQKISGKREREIGSDEIKNRM